MNKRIYFLAFIILLTFYLQKSSCDDVFADDQPDGTLIINGLHYVPVETIDQDSISIDNPVIAGDSPCQCIDEYCSNCEFQ